MSSSLTAARVHRQIPYRRCLARGCGAAARRFRLQVAIVATLSLAFQVAAQEPAFLVKNINTGIDPNASSLANLYRFETYSFGLAVNASVYFAAYEREHGRELWRTDGTPEGTFLLADTNPGPAGGLVSNPVAADGILFFTATDSEHGTELWKTDGTPRGTALVKDINPEGDGIGSSLTVANGLVFFIGDDGRDSSLWRSDGTSAGTVPLAKMRWARLEDVDGTLFALTTDSELWTSDGTRAGTVHVADIDRPGCPFQQFSVLATGNGRVYFWGEDLSGLWTSDGTPAGTVQLTDRCPDLEWITVDRITFLIVHDEVTGGELWRTDGTAEGTKLVKDINPGPADAFFDENNYYSPQFRALGGTLYFIATDGVSGLELWKSDGTEAGTVMVKDTVPGAQGISACSLSDEYDDADCLPWLIAVGDLLFFTGIDVAHGREIWKSDGTADGTVLVDDLYPGPDSLYLIAWTAIEGTLYFIHQGYYGGSALWRTDGTAGGTAVVASGEFFNPVPVGRSLFLLGRDPQAGIEPWWSDGTRDHTFPLKDIFRGDAGSSPQELTDVGGTLFFTADDGLHGRELWRSDATQTRTVGVADIRPGAEGSSPTELTVAGGRLFFVADDGIHGPEPWCSDGTREGTRLLADINPGPQGSAARDLLRVGDGLFFVADDGIHGQELWRSDGTQSGTRLVADLIVGPAGSFDIDNGYWLVGDTFVDLNDTLIFVGYDGTSYQMESRNLELWRSDGTAAGTTLLRDIVPGPRGSYPTGFAVAGGLVYFTTYEPSYRTELWTSDGTEAGTILMKTFDSTTFGHTAVGRDVFFVADGNPRGLWKTDGTADGTHALTDLAGYGGSYAAANGVVFFTDEYSWWNHKLWRTDGTPAETRVVYDFGDRVESLTLTTDGETLLLGVDRSWYRDDDPPPLALWRSDGTTAGTTFLQDISRAEDAPDGPYEGAPAFTRSGSHIFFASGHDGFGRELWALPVSALLTPAPQQTATPTPTPARSNSGGGCALDPTASSGWIILLAAAVLLLLRKAHGPSQTARRLPTA